jgi:hypothetical protein
MQDHCPRHVGLPTIIIMMQSVLNLLDDIVWSIVPTQRQWHRCIQCMHDAHNYIATDTCIVHACCTFHKV